MYVCICNAVTERTIHQLVAEGSTSLNEIRALTGCADCCGKCTNHAEQVVEQAISRQHPMTRIPVIETAISRPA